jgi:hypothetical protein
VTGWAEIFLGAIAVATVLMAVVQVGVIVAAGRLARRMERLADRIEHELTPLFSHVNSIGRDAARAAASAATQVERAETLFSDVARRVEDTMATVQSRLTAPVREGRAALIALRAALEVLRGGWGNGRTRRRRGDDEDALFI